MFRKEEINDWVSRSKAAHTGLFSELDVFLRAIDRFFDSVGLASSAEDAAEKNYIDDLVMARDAILRILAILEVVIPETRKNAFWLRKFAETKLLTESGRDMVRKELYRNDTPEKGLYLLYDSFINVKNIISDLLLAGHVSYTGFMNMGHMISKQIRENLYFNPFSKNINPEYDVISSPGIAEIIKTLRRGEVRKYVSVIYLHLYRFLRILRFVDIETQRHASLNSSLIVLMLLDSEMRVFGQYLERAGKKIQESGLVLLLESMEFQFSMEKKRVFLQELGDIYQRKSLPAARGKIENSRGILKNLTEQSIVQLTRHFIPEIEGEDIFPSFMTKLKQSLQLREDLFALLRFLTMLEERAGNPAERIKAFELLRNYMAYFERGTFRLLRYDDYEGFASFFQEMGRVKRETVLGKGFSQILQLTVHFKVFIETTLRHVANRAELHDHPVDVRKVDDAVKQYMQEEGPGAPS